MTYREALAWLYGTQRFGIKLGLDNTRRLFAALDVARPSAPVIHVAGTNGKGSVCAMIDAIARAADYHSGLYTSPHLVTFRERIRVNGEMISPAQVADGLTRIKSMVCDWDSHPTFFEITTALALDSFRQQALDIIVLETGLGGRLDATNAVPSTVSVITPVSFDHRKWLGNTLAEIASEKAGIIKANVPAIVSRQDDVVEDVIRRRAAECGAPLKNVNQSYTASPIRLIGRHQEENAAVAIEAIREVLEVSDDAVARGLSSVEWPARFQLWDERTVIDGAHNAASATVLAKTWQQTFGEQRATLIFAALADKDIESICAALEPVSNCVYLPRISSDRAANPVDVSKFWQGRSEVCSDFAEAWDKTQRLPSPILITGSLHFAGEALAILQGTPAAFEECLQ